MGYSWLGSGGTIDRLVKQWNVRLGFHSTERSRLYWRERELSKHYLGALASAVREGRSFSIQTNRFDLDIYFVDKKKYIWTMKEHLLDWNNDGGWERGWLHHYIPSVSQVCKGRDNEVIHNRVDSDIDHLLSFNVHLDFTLKNKIKNRCVCLFLFKLLPKIRSDLSELVFGANRSRLSISVMICRAFGWQKI